MVRSGELNKLAPKEAVSTYLKNFGKGFVSEGLWEENIQESIQTYESRLAQGIEKQDHINGPLTHLVNNAYAFTKAAFSLGRAVPYAGTDEDHAMSAILLGGMIGGGMSLVSSYWDNKNKADAIQTEKTLWTKLKGINKASTNLLVDDYRSPLKKFDEGYINPETNAAEIDPMKQFNLIANATANKAHTMEALSAAVLGDATWGEYNKAMAAAAHI